MNDKCTLTDEELIEKCNEWVSKLAKTGGKAWSLRVPVNFNTDPDMLFIELDRRMKAYKILYNSTIAAIEELIKEEEDAIDRT